jgi:hypothetical protein
MHNFMIKVQGSHVLLAAAGQVYTSEHYACSGHETEQSLSNMVWKAEALKTVVSRICIVLIKQPPGQAEGNEYSGKEGRKGDVKTTNK